LGSGKGKLIFHSEQGTRKLLEIGSSLDYDGLGRNKGASMSKPTVQLTGNDGNALGILSACMKAARKAGWNKEQVKEFQDKATSGDYDYLLNVVCEYFDVY
jgi:hypothetical protein